MKTIQFPFDFTITENPYLDNALNYIHQRPDGSIISILQQEDSELYEVWDEKHMEFPEPMDFYELSCYLQSSVSQLLTYQFFLNEDLILN
jgi:hypothetical protein